MNEVSLSGSSSLAVDATVSVQSLSAQEVLEVWERGRDQAPVEKALTLLAAACPGTSPDTLALLSIGQRDAYLIELREKLFGSRLTSLTDCPECGERLEMTFSVSDVCASSKAEPASIVPTAMLPGTMLSVNRAGYELQLRLPNSLDLLTLAGSEGQAEMRERLFEKCVRSARHNGRNQSVLTAEMPNEVIEAAIEQIARADPQADVQVDLTCPCCSHEWQAGFDIVSYLWSELHARATNLLREIHLLASAYGWRESEILSMSARRRESYVEILVG